MGSCACTQHLLCCPGTMHAAPCHHQLRLPGMPHPATTLQRTSGARCSPGHQPPPRARRGILAALRRPRPRPRGWRSWRRSAAADGPGWRQALRRLRLRPPAPGWRLSLLLGQGCTLLPRAAAAFRTRLPLPRRHPPPGRHTARPGRRACWPAAPPRVATARELETAAPPAAAWPAGGSTVGQG